VPTPEGRVTTLVARYGLGAGAESQLLTLLQRITTDPHAPTSIRDPARAADDHLADSLVALELPQLAAAETIVDIGAGAGLPGLPLAIALPGTQVTLLEANTRKCRFIESAAAACELVNARIVAGRAEDWPEGIAGFDVVTVRALARLDVVVEYAAPLLRIGGVLVAWRGRRDADDDAAGALAAVHLGLEASAPIVVTPYPGAQYRHLHVMRKLQPTPAEFPRRAGMARKRPLGGRANSSDRERR
jgi:16S rRNA (guanine527-N7)-methyltransferase